MNLFTQKNILQKIIISILVVILLFEFIAPNISRAADYGGVLFSPIQKVVLTIGDATMWLVGKTIGGQDGENMIYLSTEGHVGRTILFFIAGAVTGLAAGAAIILTGGLAAIPVGTVLTISAGAGGALGFGSAVLVAKVNDEKIMPEKFQIPMFVVTPEKIFANKVPFLNANIMQDSTDENKDTPIMQMKSTISTWYIALRNLAIVIMLSVLLYIGIRIIISSTANSKVKYKEMLTDWVIGMLLIFFMHYIIAFAFSMVDMLNNAISQSIQLPVISLNLKKYKDNMDDETKKAIAKLGGQTDITDYENVPIITDFTGYARIFAQLNYADTDTDEQIEENEMSYMAYTIVYAVMIMYTIMFSWKYLKRLVYIIFLIMISPLIGLSYPLDKMNDGSAQAFNMWLKEFLFTLLIQPFHLLLYTVLIGMAINLATQNIIYTLVVFGFMLPAEKILKKFFGFDRKAPIGESAMGGAVGGAIAMQAINSISKGVKNAKNIASKVESGSSNSNNRIRTQEQPVAISDRKADQGADAEDEYMNEALGINGVQNVEVNNASDSANVDEARRQQLSETNDNSEENATGPKLVNNMGVNVKVPEVKDMEGENDKTGNAPNVNIRFPEPKVEKAKAFSKPKEMAKKAFTRVKNSRVGAAASVVGPSLGRGAKNVGKAVLAGVPTAIVAGTGATIGVAAGLASDDYTNVLKYGLAGAGAGAGVGLTGAKAVGGVLGGVASTAYRKIPNGVREINAKYYQNQGKERYQEYLNKQSDKAFMKSKEVKEQYQKAFGEQYKEVMEKAMEYRKHGVTDNEVIIKAMKSKAKGVGKDYADSKRIAAAKLAKNVNNEKDVETIGNRLKDRGVSEAQIRQQKDMLRDIRGLF